MPDYGLYAEKDFLIAPADTLVSELAPWIRNYFGQETLAIPAWQTQTAFSDSPVAPWDDLQAWAARAANREVDGAPPLVWLGAPEQYSEVQLAGDGTAVDIGGTVLPCRLVARHLLNRAWFDRRSVDYLAGVALKIRARRTPEGIEVRIFWPMSWRLPSAFASAPRLDGALSIRARLRDLSHTDFSVERWWQRPGTTAPRPGQSVLALMLNGAQGDDDEAHAGHFALCVGRVGEAGAMDGWLVNNFYTLDAESEKGIVAAPVPLDNYLGDLNSGQAWYRPSAMLVLALRGERTACEVQSVLSRLYAHFYRHRIAYHHAQANCTGLSMRALRTLGWRVPAQGPESRLKGCLALAWVALRERSLRKGRLACDYLWTERTALFPALAFEACAEDLLALIQGAVRRTLTPFEARLVTDVESVSLVGFPQLPSSRAMGGAAVASFAEYAERLPADPAQQQRVPVPERRFPSAWRDPLAPAESWLPSAYVLAAWMGGLFVAILLILWRLLA